MGEHGFLGLGLEGDGVGGLGHCFLGGLGQVVRGL